MRKLAAGAVALAGLLGGCGGDGSAPAAGTIPPADGQPGTGTRRVLLIGMDGVNYPELSALVTQKQAPALAQLTLAPAYTGGVSGTVTQQETLAGPGWATLLTGAWSNRHGVTSDQGDHVMRADTLFSRLKQAGAGGKIAVAASWGPLARQLSADVRADRVDQLVDCAGVDACVTDAALRAVADRSYGVVVANFHAPAIAAGGMDSDYRRALAALDKQVGQLMSALQASSKLNPGEDWLVVATTSRPMQPKDYASDAAAIEDTSFIGLNHTGNAVFTAAAKDAMPASKAELYTRPSTADVAPTVLGFLGALPASPAQYGIEGQSLLGTPGVQQLRASAGRDAGSIRLNWKLGQEAPQPAQIEIFRNGTKIASLAGDASEYVDTDVGLAGKEEGTYSFDYVVVAGAVPVAYRAAISYVPPVVLLPTLLDRLMHFFSFDNGLTDSKSTDTLRAMKTPPPAPLFGNDGLGGKSLVINPAKTSYDLVSDVPAQARFSIGFWYKSDAQQAWLPVLTNKDWNSGANRGFIIGQSSVGTMTFNFGDGSNRADAFMAFTANQWVYVALTVDTVAKKATGYIADPVLGIRSAAISLSALNMAALRANRLVFNEDATGGAYPGYTTPTAVAPEYNDLAFWSREIDAREVKALFAAGKSLSTLNP
ncbi:hypothetical protein P3W85_28575 [Cupriavidus basilensis]|uniref:Concanavalin A-like lectin/glucanase superfamily protein n=1 Tax=Cupriavidus basilensis TaxID=68895 RepID=A0ABT6AW84_9BURK|nr:LamG-like jellyroll fold domain-containing protein [Cupriavidus basilensis]MDF3836875.1 hypothetical protein [Cupriavidus basilensis]